MIVLDSASAVYARCRTWRDAGSTIGFVPTMGALHEGHVSLVQQALAANDCVIVSIFVNPTQFDRQSDLDSYPTDVEADLDLLRTHGVQAAFVGQAADLYGENFSCWVQPEGDLVANLCGRTRGTHFRGVATIVSKLFNIVAPTRAYFGEKDFQQLAIIRQLVEDLNFAVEVVGGKTVRESDGLALSSRNRRLSAVHRNNALAIPQSLSAACRDYANGENRSEVLVNQIIAMIEQSGGRVDYADIVDSRDLTLAEKCNDTSRIAVAAFFGEVRLIDNCSILSPPIPD